MGESEFSASAVFARESDRLRLFIRRRMPDSAEVDDILQDIFADLVEAETLPEPIEQVGAWLYRVARNRIADWFRRRARRGDDAPVDPEQVAADPDFGHAREMLVEALADALEELPDPQREVFLAHEIEGMSFRDIAEATGIGVNTLLSRKHYAVQHLRARLADIYEEFVARGVE